MGGIIATLQSLPNLAPGEKSVLEELRKLSPDGTIDAALGTIISSTILPKFLYFADYQKMSGQISLDDFLTKKKNNQLDDGQRIFSSLLSLASTSAEELRDAGKFDELKAQLESVSNKLTQEIFKYWKQNDKLRVEFDLRPGLSKDAAPFNTGMIFRTRVYNTLHQVTVSFDERSTGFIWFFSFLVWFSELSKVFGTNLVVLLDEPGLSLHGRAQEDLLRFIKEQLQPKFQVMYTTHSPFMIDPDNLLGVRTVEDRSKDDLVSGTKISDKVLNSDQDTVFPLQAALGYDIAQSLFIGKHNLLVEGPSDLLYLTWASRQLQESQEQGLDKRWIISPTGGH